MDKQIIEQKCARVWKNQLYKQWRRQGKVRDIYIRKPDKIILVSTDRYSAFDHNLALIH